MTSTLKLPDPELVTDSESLSKLVKTLNHQPVVAVDTESNSLYAYQEQVCLIQFSIPETDYLIDPLSIPDLSPLGGIFKNPKIEKVFHAAEYDLICLKRDFNFEFSNLFDTMVAARILGWEEVGLGSILEAEFGLIVDKRYQRANWGERPLPQKLLSYAQLDTHYLIAIRDRIYKKLLDRHLLPLAMEDFTRTCHGNGRNEEHKNHSCWRINGAHDLPPKKASVLLELCHYRDQTARALNRPIFKVIGDATLLKIAQQNPRNLEELAQVPGITQRLLHQHGSAILHAVKDGLRSKPLHPNHASRPDEHFINRLDHLRNWRKYTAQKMGVQSDVVLPRNLMHILAEKNPQDIDELSRLLSDVPWRLQHFGAQILEVLSKT